MSQQLEMLYTILQLDILSGRVDLLHFMLSYSVTQYFLSMVKVILRDLTSAVSQCLQDYTYYSSVGNHAYRALCPRLCIMPKEKQPHPTTVTSRNVREQRGGMAHSKLAGRIVRKSSEGVTMPVCVRVALDTCKDGGSS